MKILVLNAGSTSMKYCLYDMGGEAKVLAKGLSERIGIDGRTSLTVDGEKMVFDDPLPTHEAAFRLILALLTDPARNILMDIRELNGVGHRFAHGGWHIGGNTLVNGEIRRYIPGCHDLTPLQSPYAELCIDACTALLGAHVPQALVCDTSFHATMPKRAYLTPLPKDLREKYHIRRYGFHGTSHQYVAEQAALLMNRPLPELNLITCHLGGGCSVTAIEKGRSVDTSMEYSGISGVPMGTRIGDLDPHIQCYILEHEGMAPAELQDILYHRSGLRAIAGVGPDLREIEAAAAAGNEDAKDAVELFCYRIKKYIGAYFAALNGADAIVFTAGIGENSPGIRAGVLEGLDRLGILLDTARNESCRGKAGKISPDGAPVAVYAIPTDEELMIARETVRLIQMQNA